MNTSRRRRSLALVVTALLLVGFAVLFGWRLMVWSEIGWAGMIYFPDISRNPASEMMSRIPLFGRESGEVMLVVPGSPADRAGIGVGDQIVAVENVPIHETDPLLGLARSLREGDPVSYSIRRDGQVRSLDLELESPFQRVPLIVSLVTSVLVGLAFLSISLMVYWSRPRSEVAQVFFVTCAIGAILYFLLAFVELDVQNLRGVMPNGMELVAILVIFAYGVIALLLSVLLFHLALTFPRERPVLKRWPALRRWVYILPFLAVAAFVVTIVALEVTQEPAATWVLELSLAALLAAALLRLRSRKPKSWMDLVIQNPLTIAGVVLAGFGLLAPLLRLLPRQAMVLVVVIFWLMVFLAWMISLVIYSILTCIALYRSYRESTVEEKRQVRWPLWGTLVAIAASTVLGGLALVVSQLEPQYFVRHAALGSVVGAGMKLLYLLVPVSFAIAIRKYRLMDIDLIIRKTIVYGGVTAFVVVAYLVLVGGIGVTLVSSVGIENQMVTVLSTLVIAVLFVPVRNRIQSFVDRRFFQREADFAETRRAIGDVVVSGRELETVVSQVAEALQRALQCRTLVILVRDPESDRLTALAKVGIPDELIGQLRFDADSGIASRTSQVFEVDPESLADPERSLLRRAQARIVALARAKGETVGMVLVGRRLSREPYEEADRQFLATVADQLALGIRSLGRRREDVEFAQARDIQRSLLPDVIPQIRGAEIAGIWIPARQVSGDYYDVIRFDETRVAFCIADVVGKGMPAALLMSNLQAAVKAIAPTEAPADVVTTGVRRVICQNLSGGRFVTLFYGTLDSSTGRIQYTNAGHNPPILARDKGDIVRLETGGGAMVRLMLDSSLDRGEAELRPGDRLVLFTDGLTEAQDDAGEMFGEEAVIELIRANRRAGASELASRIAERVRAFAGGEFQDDVTLIVIAAEESMLPEPA